MTFLPRLEVKLELFASLLLQFVFLSVMKANQHQAKMRRWNKEDDFRSKGFWEPAGEKEMEDEKWNLVYLQTTSATLLWKSRSL